MSNRAGARTLRLWQRKRTYRIEYQEAAAELAAAQLRIARLEHQAALFEQVRATMAREIRELKVKLGLPPATRIMHDSV